MRHVEEMKVFAGERISHVIDKALEKAKLERCIVYFEFNDRQMMVYQYDDPIEINKLYWGDDWGT